MEEKLKKIIKIALYLVLIMVFLGVIMDLISFDLKSAFYGFVWLAISALFIERIHKGKIGKLGWILAGIFAFLGIALFSAGFILALIGLLRRGV